MIAPRPKRPTKSESWTSDQYYYADEAMYRLVAEAKADKQAEKANCFRFNTMAEAEQHERNGV